MKKCTSIFPEIKKSILFFLVTFLFYAYGNAQNCNEATLFQKYWQYNERFHKTFIVQDREPSGCINDGIGFSNATSTTSCQFSKQGYGLPATNLMISPFGWGAPGAQVNQRHDSSGANIPFFDQQCAGSISWGNAGPDDPDHRFNWIDFGSETLTQLGWHFVNLSTEYELLRRSGQEKEQQKVLEEIFLGIQAIRRLDMQAQCMIKEMYDKRSPGEDLVCDEPYSITGPEDINPFNSQPCHRHWDAKVQNDCDFTPDFSGYNGFFIRGDAAQNLENILHDPTDESYNVDAVGGAFGAINNDDDACDDVDPFCWMSYTQHFISHDQLINLFYGFTFIKKYIPAEATVTTCNGDVYKPLEMMQRISEAIVTKINDNGDHITLPGSKDCCNKPVKLSECEGGNLRLTLYGLLKADQYIQGKDTRTTLTQQAGFEWLANTKSGRSFFLKESCMFKDLSKVSNFNQTRMADIAKDKHKEILMLGNDLLFPDGESVADMVGGEAFFKQLLCEAPCSGPCHADKDFSAEWPGESGRWPEGFYCANTPGWEGTRWDGEGAAVEEGAGGPPRRSNGLDYMTLFNMYMLKYGDGDFYNPESIEQSNNLTVFQNISGPNILCGSSPGHYEITAPSPNIENLLWNSTSNMTISNPSESQTNANFNTNSASSGVLSVQYVEGHAIMQYYNGLPAYSILPNSVIYNENEDKCEMNWTKTVKMGGVIPSFQIITQNDPCSYDFSAGVRFPEGTLLSDYNYSWTVTHDGQDQITGTDPLFYFMEEFLDIYGATYLHLYDGTYHIQLTVSDNCGGSSTITKTIEIDLCDHGGHHLQVNPNPTRDALTVNIVPFATDGSSVPYVITVPEGYPAYIKNINGGPALINTRVYTNGQSINVSTLSNGYYNLYLDTGSTQPLSTTFIIIR